VSAAAEAATAAVLVVLVAAAVVVAAADVLDVAGAVSCVVCVKTATALSSENATKN